MSNTKHCSRCDRTLPLSEFYKKGEGKSHFCKICTREDNNKRYHERYGGNLLFRARVRAYSKDYHAKNGEKLKQKQRHNHYRQRDECIAHYGGKCACCGEARREFLAIDHINGGGRKHHKEVHGHVVRWLVKNGFPPGFRVLCHNCNMSLGQYGYCPHAQSLQAAL